MPPFDTHPALGHAEVAAWALGALDQPDAEAFGEIWPPALSARHQ